MKEQQAATQLMETVNDYSFDHQKSAQAVCCEHKTLQQSYFRFIIAVIREMAKDSHLVDDHNRAAHETSKRIVESGALDDVYLPFI